MNKTIKARYISNATGRIQADHTKGTPHFLLASIDALSDALKASMATVATLAEMAGVEVAPINFPAEPPPQVEDTTIAKGAQVFQISQADLRRQQAADAKLAGTSNTVKAAPAPAPVPAAQPEPAPAPAPAPVAVTDTTEGESGILG